MHRLRSIGLALGIALALALGLWASPLVMASTPLTVGPGGDYATIQAAIDAARDGDVIAIRSGVYNENLVINKSVTLLGGFNSTFSNRTPRTTTVNGSATACPTIGIKSDCGTSVLSVSGQAVNEEEVSAGAFTPPVSPDALFVTLDGIVVTGGSRGGVHIYTPQDSRIELVNLLIEGNQASAGSEMGGGVYAQLNNRSTLVIADTDVINNSATQRGGGLYIRGSHAAGPALSPTLLVRNSTIQGNQATRNGGADIQLERFATVELENVLLQENTASNSNGALALDLSGNATLAMRDIRFLANQAQMNWSAGRIALIGSVVAQWENIYVGHNLAENGSSGLLVTGDENVHIVADRIIAEHNDGSDGSALAFELNNRAHITVTQLLSLTHNLSEDGSAGATFDATSNASVQVADLYAAHNDCTDCSGAALNLGSGYFGSQFRFDNVTFIANTNQGDYGGAMYADLADGSRLSIAQGHFAGNHVAEQGGGLYIDTVAYGSQLELRNISFITNTADSDGGGLYLGYSYDGVGMVFEDLTFIDNMAGGYGGGLYIGEFAEECVYARFNRNQFLGNRASGDGGGLYVSDGFAEGCHVEIKDNIFRDNIADGDGGGAYFEALIYYGGSAAFSGNVFANNHSLDDGGGAYFYTLGDDGAYVTFTHNEFSDNHAENRGGGAYFSSSLLDSGGFLTFTHNSLAGNYAGGKGGGLSVNSDLVYNASALLAHNTIVDNVAEGDGGGMYLSQFTYEGSSVQFRDNIVSRNTITGAGNGGGISAGGTYDGDMLWFTGNVITGNVAPGDGGGLHISGYFEYGSYVEFADNVISDNQAGASGGGCAFGSAWENGAAVYFLRNDISRNSSGDSAGGCYIHEIADGALAEIAHNRINDNSAAADGGALYINSISEGGAELNLRSNELIGNRAGYTNESPTGGAAGALIIFSVDGPHQVRLIDNKIVGNRAYATVEGIGGDFGGLGILNVYGGALILLQDNEIRDNSAGGNYGGAMIWMHQGRLVAKGNTLAANDATHTGSGLNISAASNVEAIIEGNRIVGNDAASLGGLSLESAAGSTLYAYTLNNLIAANSHGVQVVNFPYYSIHDTIADNGGPGITVQGTLDASAQLTNTIVWGNANGAISAAPTQTVTINYSLIQGGHAGTDNLADDPLFVDAAGGDYRLQADSPAIDSAHTPSAPLVDLDGLLRPVGAAADRGAYEWRIAGVDLTGPATAPTGQPGLSTTFLITITNQSNHPDTFWVTVEDNPQNWPVSLGLHSSAAEPLAVTLDPDETTVVEAQVTIPADAPGGTTNPLLIVVKSQSNGAVVDSAQVPISAATVGNVTIGPDHNGTAETGTAIVYEHTLTNNGNFTDTISLQADSASGWPVVATPASVRLAPGASASVRLSVTVPVHVGGETDVTTLTAISSAQTGTTRASATDTTSVPQHAGVDLSLGTAKQVVPDTTVHFTHRITNTGNGPDTFALSYHASAGWTVSGPESVALDPGSSQAIHVTVSVPADAAGTTDVTTVQATSAANGAVSAAAQNTTVVATVGVKLLPDNVGIVRPGGTVAYTHTVVNTGAAEDTYTLAYTSSAGWIVNGPESVTVAGGEDAQIVLQITMPADSDAEEDVTIVTATSTLDAARQATATNTTRVGGANGFLPWLAR